MNRKVGNTEFLIETMHKGYPIQVVKILSDISIRVFRIIPREPDNNNIIKALKGKWKRIRSVGYFATKEGAIEYAKNYINTREEEMHEQSKTRHNQQVREENSLGRYAAEEHENI